MADRPQDDQDDAFDPDAVDANRSIQKGGGVGARELRKQEDPHGSGTGTPDGEGGADGVERIEPGAGEG